MVWVKISIRLRLGAFIALVALINTWSRLGNDCGHGSGLEELLLIDDELNPSAVQPKKSFLLRLFHLKSFVA